MTSPSFARIAQRLTEDWNTNRHSTKGWPQFLEAIQISGLRGWQDELIEFRFPVVAIAGENGSGKSTIIKAAATAYRSKPAKTIPSAKTFYPDDFFPNTPWETVSGVSITTRLRLGESTLTNILRKPTKRWRGMPERPERNTFFLDISRTQPIDTLIGYAKIAKAATIRGEEVALDDASRNLLGRILGRTYAKGTIVTQDGKQIGVLERDGTTYSNFHQGAGEDATTDLVALLAALPNNSIVMIDEVESSLHPRAQRRLMTELLELARSKRLQLILSTHSPYVLEQLPTEARIYIQGARDGSREILYGVTPQFALSLMDEVSHPELTAYTEDERAAVVLDRILAEHIPNEQARISILPVGPASTVRTLGEVAAAGKFDRTTVGILDADQKPASGCLVLPGDDATERVVFNGLTEAQWAKVASRLGVRAGDLLDAVEDARRLEKHHTWPQRTAQVLGDRIRQTRVWEDAAAVWVESNRDEESHKAFAQAIRDLLAGRTEGED